MKTYVQKDLYINIHSNFICNTPKLQITQCSLPGKQISKLWYFYTTEHNLTIKRNQILIHTTTWKLKKLYQTKDSQKKIFFLYEFIYTKLLENEISSTAKESRSMTSWNLGDLKRGRKKQLAMMDMFIPI